MIRSYRDKRTAEFAGGGFVRAFQGCAQQAAKRLDAAASLDDLRNQRSDRLEALAGDRAGQYSIRVDMQWRICFAWPAGSPGPVCVEIVDHH